MLIDNRSIHTIMCICNKNIVLIVDLSRSWSDDFINPNFSISTPEVLSLNLYAVYKLR